jgi:fatty acyl-CoA reductase
MQELLPSTMVEDLRACNKIRVLHGDLTSEHFGLDEETLQDLRSKVSIYIHSAASISLKAGLQEMTSIIVDPSLVAAEMALGFTHLERFVFVSTAYVNGYLHWLPVQDGARHDCTVDERIYPLRPVAADDDAHAELKNIKHFGTTPEYSCLSHPYAYSYAKHLTERLLLSTFDSVGRKQQLLIFRPSCIGPAEQEPFPNFEAAGSAPLTTATCAVITALPGKVWCPSNLVDPTKATTDEVPVDIVVNRLVVHLAMGTSGCVHAVSGISHRRSTIKLYEAMADNRSRWWGRPVVAWCEVGTPEEKLWPAARLYKIWGCSFHFQEEKTQNVWQLMDPLLQQRWPLFTRRDPSDTSDFVNRGQNARKMLLAWLGKKYGRFGRWLAMLMCLGPRSSTSVLDSVALAAASTSRVSLSSCIDEKSTSAVASCINVSNSTC